MKAKPQSLPRPHPASLNLDDGRYYTNRELSLLAFQERVLREVTETSNPLLERTRFLSILSSNLDEFFMVRLAVLKQRVKSGSAPLSLDGRSGYELLDAIRKEVIRLNKAAYACLSNQLIPALAAADIRIVDYKRLDAPSRTAVDRYFQKTVFPVLTPLAFDPGRPFPHISNLSLNLAVSVKDRKGGERFARVKVPNTLPQLVPVPSLDHSKTAVQRFVWLEQVIAGNLRSLFPGLQILEAHPFHVTRDAEVAIQEVESDDLLETIEEAVWRRRFRAVVRFQTNPSMPRRILRLLQEEMEINDRDTYIVDGPLDLGRLRQLNSLNRPDLTYPLFNPHTPPELQPNPKKDIFAQIREGDILLHHPFESFQPVVEFIRTAAKDPDVLAIKMTLYRIGRNSPIVEALLEAIEEGKQVSVLLELKARFDEESNIEWAKTLEREGVHVIYGLVGLKVHSKIALVVRREGEVMRRYVHIGTGNYNTATARAYTDLSLFTCDEEIGSDATDLFNYLTGYSAMTEFRKLLVSPLQLRQGLAKRIQREIAIANEGKPAHLIFKMNALEDPDMIKLLYQASQAGVRVDLLVRGLCCLKPGIPGVSENIRVSSILGRFLEHSRIFYFQNGGEDEVYIGSADLMPRNLNRRVEIASPVDDPRLVRRIRDEILGAYLADNVNAHELGANGKYIRRPRSESSGGVDSQLICMTPPERAHRFEEPIPIDDARSTREERTAGQS